MEREGRGEGGGSAPISPRDGKRGEEEILNVIPAVLLLLLLSCSTLRRRKPKASFSTFFSSQPQSSFSPCLSGVSVQKWLLSSFLRSPTSFLSLSRSSFLLPMEILWGSNEAGFQGGRDGGLRHGPGLAAAGAGATAKEPNRLGGETPIFPSFFVCGKWRRCETARNRDFSFSPHTSPSANLGDSLLPPRYLFAASPLLYSTDRPLDHLLSLKLPSTHCKLLPSLLPPLLLSSRGQLRPLSRPLLPLPPFVFSDT